MKHMDHIKTDDLRRAYRFLYKTADESNLFDINEIGPSPKRTMNFKYPGLQRTPFALIVNSGARKTYHLFYLRQPLFRNMPEAKVMTEALILLPDKTISRNRKGELTIELDNLHDAEKAWQLMTKCA